MTADIDTERLALIGQIQVVRERLTKLEDGLLSLPLGYAYKDEAFEDAQGNLSFQVGGLIGRLTRYRALLK